MRIPHACLMLTSAGLSSDGKGYCTCASVEKLQKISRINAVSYLYHTLADVVPELVIPYLINKVS